MWGLFRPGARFDALLQLPVEELAARGFRLVLLDVDNTVTTWNNPEVEPAVVAWFAELRRAGILACLLSNNSAERLAPLAAKLGCQFFPKAGKPRPGGYKRACRQFGAERSQTLMVGDQLLTDILGANLAGLASVLVTPISLAREFKWTYVNRRIEGLIKGPVLKPVPHNRLPERLK